MDDSLKNLSLDSALLTLVEALPEELVPELERLVDAGDPAAVEAYLRTHIPNLEEVVREKATQYGQK